MTINLSNLSSTKPSNKKRRRVGRGIAAGKGKTAGRGTKGQKSRTGFKKRVNFPNMPKLKGFKSRKRKPKIIYAGGALTERQKRGKIKG